MGDILEEGVILYPETETRIGITSATIIIDNVNHFTLNKSNPEYTTDRKLKLCTVTPSVYSRNICEYDFKTYDESDYLQKINQKNTHFYVGDMKIGDVAGAGCTLHSSENGKGYTSFEIYIDRSSQRANESYFEWSPSAPVRLVSVEQDFYDPNKLIMRLETFYAEGEVGSEAALNAALNSDETIVLANNICLSDCFFVRDGREHTLDLNGYTLSRSLDSKPATGHVFQVNSGSKLTIKDSSTDGSGLITGGCAPNGGGAYIEGDLILEGGVISGNTADNGAGIFVRNGSVTIKKNVIIEENAAKNGGGIYICRGGTVTVSGNIENNKANENGGGIYNLGKLELSKAFVSSDTAEKSGAGIWSDGTAVLKNSEISHNTNAESGGGITNCASMTVSGCTVSGNSAKDCGGAVMLDEGAQTTFTGNNSIGENCAKNGGGIYVKKGSAQIKEVAFEGNIASASGGAMFLDSGTDLTLDSVSISGCGCTSNGAGVYTKGALTLCDSTISSNNGGFGVYFDSDNKLTLKNTSIKGNAGGIYMNAGSIILAGGNIIVNDNRKDNTDCNISFKSFKKLKVTGELYSDSRIGITPPANSDNRDLTDDYSDYNEENADTYFFSDSSSYRISPEEEYPEAMAVKRLTSSASGYKIKVTVRVTDDADWWDDAYLYFYVNDDFGQGRFRYIGCSPDFHESIDTGDGYYEYEVNCGTAFPSAVTFSTKYGTSGSWRDFEADVRIYINGVNCCSRHCVHNVYGVERKNTSIEIPAEKFPRAFIEIDQKNEVDPKNDDTKYIKITAVDQYGVGWTMKDKSAIKIENLSFPGKDTCEMTDDTGMNWKTETALETDHFSEYRLTISSGTKETEVTKIITVHFSFPLHLKVVIDGKTVLTKTGHSNDRIEIKSYPCKAGYYINNYSSSGACFIESNGDGTYSFAFAKEDIVLTASLKGIRYTIEFKENGDPLLGGKDITGTMISKTLTYGKAAAALPKCYFTRKGYNFVGWNTKADGTGTMYTDKQKVSDLTTVPNDIIRLYAQWQMIPSSTTASIFSQGRITIYIGSVVILMTMIGLVIYTTKRKKPTRLKKRRERHEN